MAPVDEAMEQRLARLEAAAGIARANAMVTVAQLCADYLVYMQPPRSRIGGFTSTKARLNAICRRLGTRGLLDVTYTDADRYVAARIHHDGVSRSTAGQDLLALSSALKWAVRRRLIPYNSLVGYEFDLQKTTRERVFTEPEIRAMLSAANRLGHMQIFAAIAVMHWTSIRPKELIKTPYPHVDFAQGWIRVLPSIDKMERGRMATLMPEGAAALRELPRKGTAWLFESSINPTRPMSYATLNRQWHDVVDVAEIAPNENGECAELYSMRHTLATKLAIDYGLGPYELCAYMGWKNVAQAMTYIKAQERQLLATSAKLQAARRDAHTRNPVSDSSRQLTHMAPEIAPKGQK